MAYKKLFPANKVEKTAGKKHNPTNKYNIQLPSPPRPKRANIVEQMSEKNYFFEYFVKSV